MGSPGAFVLTLVLEQIPVSSSIAVNTPPLGCLTPKMLSEAWAVASTSLTLLNSSGILRYT